MKVALIGTAPGSRTMAPYSDESWEIWACSAGNSQGMALPRVTKWFELHAICDMTGQEHQAWSLPYFRWLKEQSFPVYMQEKNDLVPQAIIFPYKTMTDRFGPNKKKGLSNWFTSTVAWMIGFAVIQMKEGDEIGIFGVDMSSLEENYTAQKAGIHRMIEFANEAGIKVTIPYESCLAKPYPLYGYAEATHMGRKFNQRKVQIASILHQLTTEIESKKLQKAFFEGAQEVCEYDIRTWTDGMDADIDTDGQESQAPILTALKERAEKFGEPTALTGDFAENSAGVFVPQALSAEHPKRIRKKANGVADTPIP